MAVYLKLPDGMPFTELLYTAINIYAVIVLGPLIRIKIFKEVAEYAETGKLVADLNYGKLTPWIIYYMFATGLCYVAPIACIATISK
jgi:hypothetical protein